MKKSMLFVLVIAVSILFAFNVYANVPVSNKPSERYHVFVENDEGKEAFISWSDFSWYVLQGYQYKSEYEDKYITTITMYYYDGSEKKWNHTKLWNTYITDMFSMHVIFTC